MKREKLMVLCIALFFVQLVACERSKMESDLPVPLAARTSADSIANDSIAYDTAFTSVPDSIIIDSAFTNVPDSIAIDTTFTSVPDSIFTARKNAGKI